MSMESSLMTPWYEHGVMRDSSNGIMSIKSRSGVSMVHGSRGSTMESVYSTCIVTPWSPCTGISHPSQATHPFHGCPYSFTVFITSDSMEKVSSNKPLKRRQELFNFDRLFLYLTCNSIRFNAR